MPHEIRGTVAQFERVAGSPNRGRIGGVKAGHGGDLGAGKGQDHQPDRIEAARVRVAGVEAEGGLAIHLGNRLAALGRYEEALAAFEESVRMWRPPANRNPGRQPPLAMALDNLGAVLGRLGRLKEALAATEESVRLYRPLARDNPAYQPELARALTHLGNRRAVLSVLTESPAEPMN